MTAVDIAKTISRAETMVSADTIAQIKTIDALIAKLGVEKDKILYEPTTHIDEQIADLRAAKEVLRSGSAEEPLQPLPPSTMESPPRLIFEKKEGLENPFENSDPIPDDEDGHSKLLGAAFDYGMVHIGRQFEAFRNSKTVAEVPAHYSNRIHFALITMMVWQWVEVRHLFAVGRDRRDAVKKELIERLDAIGDRLTKQGEVLQNRNTDHKNLHESAQNNFHLLENLLRRVEKLESTKGGMEYCGTFVEGRKYTKNSVLTHDGSAWIALKETKSKPSSDDSWRLFVKRGKDGRDAR